MNKFDMLENMILYAIKHKRGRYNDIKPSYGKPYRVDIKYSLKGSKRIVIEDHGNNTRINGLIVHYKDIDLNYILSIV